MSQSIVLILFEFVALIFAFTIHESAHAWMASRCGDQTARQLGRISLNPLKHLDPLGSVVLPLIAAFSHLPLIGWAKPTPVTTRNLRNYKRDDILVTIAGPISNLLTAAACLLVLVGVRHLAPGGEDAVSAAVSLALGMDTANPGGVVFPVILLLFCGILVNLSLAVFNVIPVPPLDGSRVLRHFLPYGWRERYDQIGRFSLLLLLLVGGRLMGFLFTPVLLFFLHLLFRL